MKKRRLKEKDAAKKEAREDLRKITRLLMKSSSPLGKTAQTLGSTVEQHNTVVALYLMGGTCESMSK